MKEVQELSQQENKKLKQNQGSLIAKIAIMALFVPTISWNAFVHTQAKNSVPIGQCEETKNSDVHDEHRESINSYEATFKEGMRRTLKTVNSLADVPVGGKKIDYYRLEWSQKWKKINPEMIKKLGFPEIFDITPKKITKPTNSIEIRVGDRYFTVCPSRGTFTALTMTQNALQLNISAVFSFTIEYDKDEKLPLLLLKLWDTPRGAWVKTWFPWSVVTEIKK